MFTRDINTDERQHSSSANKNPDYLGKALMSGALDE